MNTVARRRPATKPRQVPTLKPPKTRAYTHCSANHPEIGYLGRHCPQCHEAEATAILRGENEALRRDLASAVSQASITPEIFMQAMRGFGATVKGLSKAVELGRLEAQSAEARMVQAFGDVTMKLGAMDDAISVLVCASQPPVEVRTNLSIDAAAVRRAIDQLTR